MGSRKRQLKLLPQEEAPTQGLGQVPHFPAICSRNAPRGLLAKDVNTDLLFQSSLPPGKADNQPTRGREFGQLEAVPARGAVAEPKLVEVVGMRLSVPRRLMDQLAWGRGGCWEREK